MKITIILCCVLLVVCSCSSVDNKVEPVNKKGLTVSKEEDNLYTSRVGQKSNQRTTITIERFSESMFDEKESKGNNTKIGLIIDNKDPVEDNDSSTEKENKVNNTKIGLIIDNKDPVEDNDSSTEKEDEKSNTKITKEALLNMIKGCQKQLNGYGERLDTHEKSFASFKNDCEQFSGKLKKEESSELFSKINAIKSNKGDSIIYASTLTAKDLSKDTNYQRIVLASDSSTEESLKPVTGSNYHYISYRNKYSQLLKKLRESEETISNLHTKISSLETKVSNLTVRYNEKEAENKNLLYEIELWKQKYNDLLEKYNELVSRYNILFNTHKELKKDYDVLNKTCKNYEKLIKSLDS